MSRSENHDSANAVVGTYAFEQRLGFGGEGHVGGEGEGGVENLLVHDVQVLRVEGGLQHRKKNEGVSSHKHKRKQAEEVTVPGP